MPTLSRRFLFGGVLLLALWSFNNADFRAVGILQPDLHDRYVILGRARKGDSDEWSSSKIGINDAAEPDERRILRRRYPKEYEDYGERRHACQKPCRKPASSTLASCKPRAV